MGRMKKGDINDYSKSQLYRPEKSSSSSDDEVSRTGRMLNATKDAAEESLGEHTSPNKKRKKGKTNQPDSFKVLQKYMEYCEDAGNILMEGNNQENIWKQRYHELDQVGFGFHAFLIIVIFLAVLFR